MKNLSPTAYEDATMPSCILTEKYCKGVCETKLSSGKENGQNLEKAKPYRFVNGPKNLFHFPDLGLILEVNGCVEVWDLLIGQFCDRLALTGMQEG